MKYMFACAALVMAACSGGGGDKAPTGGSTVASVTVNTPSASISVGATETLTAVALDAQGNPLSGFAATWQTSSNSIATVVNGFVTGTGPGTVVITATMGGASKQTTITVTAVISASCSGGATPLSLAVGVPHILTAAERTSVCVGGGALGSEYVLIPFKSDTVGAKVSVTFTGVGTSVTQGAPTLAASLTRLATSQRQQQAASMLSSTRMRGAVGAAFEQRLRRAEREQLTRIASVGSRASLLRSMRRSTAGSRSAILGLPATPVVGTYTRLNTNGDSACNAPVMHAARIAAVSTNAIIAVDSLAPAGGFSDAEYASFAATFDTLVFKLDTAAFGAPADLDANGRVLIFFTQAVNQLTLPTDTLGFIGGFFFARDLFPVTTQSALLQACAASNQGEMFYVPVLDINQQFNKWFVDKTALQTELIGTLAHEFQHLINASRRLYVTQTVAWDEEVWLNEGMSHLAEEILYFHIAGFAPKQALTLSTVTANQAVLNAINNYEVQNLLRLDDYLFAPDINSPYAQNDSLETRGATTQLLRYSLDLSAGTNNSYLHSLVNSATTGTVNYNTVFATTFPNIFTAVQQQVIANFLANSGIPTDPKYAFPSWNYRDVIGNGLDNRINPLTIKTLLPNSPTTFSVTGGGAGYSRFRVGINGIATATSTSAGGAVPASVLLILIRTQ